ncbi:MAG: dethiobiotin synthase [Vicinamibacterales bacterium]
MKGFFITGTDTNIGKTVVSAALLVHLRRQRSCCYWKPIQTGTTADDDTATVRSLAGCGPSEILDAGVRLPDPVSPHLAARLAGTSIETAPLLELAPASAQDSLWIVEGAGGVLVPINDTQMMIDLIVALHLPAIVVARTTLGTINHTLLTLEALRHREVPVAGLVMVGASNLENREAIEHHGRVPVLGIMPWLAPLTPEAVSEWAQQALDPTGRLRGWVR